MLVAIEGKILPDEFIDDEILIGEIWSIGRRIVERTKDLSPNPSPNLAQHSPLFQCFLEDLLQFVDACHLIQIIQLINKSYLQGSMNKSNASNLHKQASQTLLNSRNNTFVQLPSNQRSQNQHFNSLLTADPPNSILQLLQNRETVNLNKISSAARLKNKKYLLLDIEERIFGEVIELLDQIDSLRTNIITYREDIRELQVNHPDIQELVKFHGYGQRLTAQQCDDLQEENQDLIREIGEIEARQVNSLEEVLKIEKQKYEDLKIQLSENGSTKSLEKKISDLRASISDLENSRTSRVRTQYPEFEQIQLQNEELRQKTLYNLKNMSISKEEEQLEEYLENEEKDRLEFMQELKNFKSEYNRLKSQNEALREKLQRKEQLGSKQNRSTVNIRKSPNTINPTELVDTNRKTSSVKAKNRFSEYESHIQMIQNLQA